MPLRGIWWVENNAPSQIDVPEERLKCISSNTIPIPAVVACCARGGVEGHQQLGVKKTEQFISKIAMTIKLNCPETHLKY